jgi:DNA repair photolyase
MDPRVSFINEWGERESGWQYRHPPLVRITDYDRVLDMVLDANSRERVRVTAPPGTYERSAQQAEQLANPVRERRKTVREALTGRR